MDCSNNISVGVDKPWGGFTVCRGHSDLFVTQRNGGFTLVEMLVTCALVTVLMLAVTQVFSIATTTIGGGQALGAAVRDGQAAQPVMYRDLSSVAPATSSPVFYITSQRVAAWRNARDAQGDRDGNPMTLDYNADGDETDNPEDLIPQGIYNSRNHRTDTLGFFAFDRYSRQTGELNLVDLDAAREAWVWYGHLNLANNAGVADSTTHPGVGAISTNSNNYYASQWALGRVAMLMKSAPTSGSGYVPRSGNPGTPDLTPLTFGLVGTPHLNLVNFRYDVAQGSMASFKSDVLDVINYTADWRRMIFEDNNNVGRYRANKFQTRPLTPSKAAAQVPIFVPACTQFIVEFAGDFIAQNGLVPGDPWDANGDSDLTNDTDGVIDYVKGTGKIRWYGMPRDTNGDNVISAAAGDVVPVRDIIGFKPPYEFLLPISTAQSDYASRSLTMGRYVAAWGPNDRNRPKMIRITIVIDRPEAEGKLLDGQSFEYVFNVGY